MASVLTVLGLRRPIYGMLAFFLATVCKFGELFPVLGKFRIELLLAIFAFVLLLVHRRCWKRIVSLNSRTYSALILIMLVGFLSFLQARNLAASWNMGMYPMIRNFALFLMIVAVVERELDLVMVTGVFLFASFAVCVEPFLRYAFGTRLLTSYGAIAIGTVGEAGDHVELANFSLQAVPLCICLVLSTRQYVTKAIFASLGVLLSVVATLTMSRGGFIGLGVLLLAYSFALKKEVRIAALLSVAGFGAFILFRSNYLGRAVDILNFGDICVQARIAGLTDGFHMMKAQPLLGVGVGGFIESRWQMLNYWLASHNLYGELLADLGFGSVIWVVWQFMCFNDSRRESALSRSSMLIPELMRAVQITLLLRLVLGFFVQSAYHWIWFVLSGLVVAVSELRKAKPAAPLTNTIPIL